MINVLIPDYYPLNLLQKENGMNNSQVEGCGEKMFIVKKMRTNVFIHAFEAFD